MEHYESTCPDCGHRWRWVGFKTLMFKTPQQIEWQRSKERTCPRCSNNQAKTGLDHTSPDAKALDGALGDVAQHLVSGEGED